MNKLGDSVTLLRYGHGGRNDEGCNERVLRWITFSSEVLFLRKLFQEEISARDLNEGLQTVNAWERHITATINCKKVRKILLAKYSVLFQDECFRERSEDE